MAVRIRVRIVGSSAVDTAALLNSGFESDSPDVALPPALARRVVQWPPPAARYVAADTGGGEAEFLYLESAAWLEAGGRRVLVNLLVNPYIDEAIISDYVMGELGIVILDAKRGYWRFVDDPPDTVRASEAPQRWR